jgi:two-component system cell cycle sensor histidine kinase PleC
MGNDWFWQTDEEHNFSAYAGYPGFPGLINENIIGHPRWEFASHRDLLNAAKWDQHKKMVNAHQPIRNFEFELRTTEFTWISVSGDPFYDLVGNFMGYRGVATVLTDRKIAQDKLHSALIDAESANAAKSKFLATMSHEFRTPLNAILGFSEMIADEYLGPIGHDIYKKYAHDIHQSGRHMLGLVNDILDISAIEAGKYVLDPKMLSIGEVIGDAVVTVEHAAKVKNIDLSFIMVGDVALFYIDQRSLMQILLNLLSNAIKYTNAGGTVCVEAVMRGQNLEITVEDTGVGISKEKLPHITEAFLQADSDPHNAQEGTGLGLAIVKLLVDLLDGELVIESRFNQGTCVQIIFAS